MLDNTSRQEVVFYKRILNRRKNSDIIARRFPPNQIGASVIRGIPSEKQGRFETLVGIFLKRKNLILKSIYFGNSAGMLL